MQVRYKAVYTLIPSYLGYFPPSQNKGWEKTKHNQDTDLTGLLKNSPGDTLCDTLANPIACQSSLAGLRECPTGYRKAWNGRLCPAVLLSLIISSTFIITALLLFFKERIMTPIYTRLSTWAILREWLYSSFYEEPVRLKMKKKKKKKVIQLHFLLHLKQRIKWKPFI